MDGLYGTAVPVNDEKALADAIAKELSNPREPTTQREGTARFEPARVAQEVVTTIELQQISKKVRS